MSFSISEYELLPKGQKSQEMFGSKALSHLRKGALLRVKFPEGGVGYGDCFSWPELGDLPLNAQLDGLRAGHLTEGVQSTLRCARIDAEARQAQESLFSKNPIPKSHYLVIDLSGLTPDRIQKVSELGFTRIKVKLGAHPWVEVQQLLKIFPSLQDLSMLLRLDFNGSLSPPAADHFMESLGTCRNQIDFIEDPTPYNPRVWKALQEKWGIRLALDRISSSVVRDLKKGSFSVLVLKPEIQNEKEWSEIAKVHDVPLVVTSYLGHPVGQMYSAWIASQLAQSTSVRLETCGLLSHSAYELNDFSTLLKESEGVLVPPGGFGLGFDSLLAQRDWKEL